jgi:F-type H+-transporting ATPase subunit delta
VDTVLEEFDSLLVEVFDAFPRLEAVLGSLRVSHPDKSQVLDKVLAGQASPMFLHFLKVVSRHGRLDCLRAIHAQARLLRDRSSGRVRVQLATAAPIDAAQLAAITAELRQRLGAEPVIEQVTQPELIGGAVVRVGDVVYDGSVANGFKIVREKMIQRSVHEIQSRRDRFRDSTGD